MVFKKEVRNALIFIAKQIKRVEKSLQMTWKAAVRRVLMSTKEPLALKDIYSQIEPFAQNKTNHNWQAKVRQVLQDDRYFVRVETGVYELKRA